MALTTVEKRAKAWCDNIHRTGLDDIDIAVEWKRSKTWGSNPAIESHDGKMCNVSGCGYCKLSTALADVLCFLCPVDSDEHNAIARTGGAGVNSVIAALKNVGWDLRKTASGKMFDGFKLTRS